jgi:hypothetical protein
MKLKKQKLQKNDKEDNNIIFTTKEQKIIDEIAPFINSGAMEELIELIKTHKKEYKTENNELKYIEDFEIETDPPSTEIRYKIGSHVKIFDAGYYDNDSPMLDVDDNVIDDGGW